MPTAKKPNGTEAAVASRSADGNIRLEGQLDLGAVPSLLDSSRHWFDGGMEVCIDLSGIRRSDSGGVALLLEWLRRAKAAGCSLRFRNPPAQILELIRFYQIESFLPL